MAMAATAQHALLPIGAIKSFGKYGPIYEVLGFAPRGEKGEMVKVRVVHGGETFDYSLDDMLADPWVA